MCRIFFLLLFLFSIVSGSGQVQANKEVKKNLPNQVPSKNEMSAQMKEVVNELNKQIVDLEKQIADAKKNKEDEETIKGMQDQVDILKKQVEMIKGVNKSMPNISPKTFDAAQKSDEMKDEIPQKNIKRISALPENVLTEGQLKYLLTKASDQIDKTIPAEEKAEAQSIYKEIKTKTNSSAAIANTAAACWIYGHWEKALWLSGKACLDDMSNTNNLNSYASYLLMMGSEHIALPVLQYLDEKFPKNSTILNNIGQAWFGLGDMENAKRYLEAAEALMPDHCLANLTPSKIYASEGDAPRAMAALKKSIRKNYTQEKEVELEKLGGELDDDDILFDYPVKEDAFDIEPFLSAFPQIPGSVAESHQGSLNWDAFEAVVNSIGEKAKAAEREASERQKIFIRKMSNPKYNEPILRMHQSTPYIKAQRKLPLAIKKKTALSIDEIMSMMANEYHNVTTNRFNQIENERQAQMAVITQKWIQCEPGGSAPGYCKDLKGECRERESVNDVFMSKAKVIQEEGAAAIRRIYFQHKAKVKRYVQLMGYATVTEQDVKSAFGQEIWENHQWIKTYAERFYASYIPLKKRPPMFTKCEPDNTGTQPTIQLPELKTPKCNYSKNIKLPVGKIKEECNTVNIDESRLKKRKNNSQKGEIKLTIGEITEIPEMELEVLENEITIESDASSSTNGKKIELEIGEIRTSPTQTSAATQPMPAPGNYVSIGFDSSGNTQINTTRNN
jgi:tetratricopeptide (TPR) repeat protein